MPIKAENIKNKNHLLSCNTDLKVCLETMYTDVFNDSKYIDNYFSKEYMQYADGETLNLKEFKKHIDIVKNKVKNISFNVMEASKSNNTFSDRHLVSLQLHNGKKAEIEIIQISKIKNGQIYELHELSRVISGDKALKTLSSQKHND